MRRVSIYHDKHGVGELKMTSLIDVVFLLLIFFVWTASFQIAEYVLPSSVSEADRPATGGGTVRPPSPEADFADVQLRILWRDQRPVWQLNDVTLDQLSALQERLDAIFSANATAPVVVAPDADVPLDHVIDVYDVARIVGFEQVQFAVSPEAQAAQAEATR
ncbi:MAG: ExbD/TolR family protein [Pirellulaceae bacterium]